LSTVRRDAEDPGRLGLVAAGRLEGADDALALGGREVLAQPHHLGQRRGLAGLDRRRRHRGAHLLQHPLLSA
jgi:hypothetical protein